MKFKVYQCANCGNLQSSEAAVVFKCFRCGKSKRAAKTKMLAHFGTGRESALFIQEYMKVKWEERQEWENGT